MSAEDQEQQLNDDYLDDLADGLENSFDSTKTRVETTEPPRDGLYWVRKHNHEVVSVGNEDSPEPDNKGVVQRRYFSSFENALSAWGKYVGANHKQSVAREIINEMADLESTSPHEYFFVTSDPSYLAVVMKHSDHRGRVWLRKTTIHSAASVKNARPREGKKFYEVLLSDYAAKSSPSTSGKSSTSLICGSTGQYVPLNGKCDCGDPVCQYFSM